MRQAYGYIRTSTTEQLNKSGPKRQEEKIRSYARANDIEIAKIYTEDISGTTDVDKRSKFMDMLTEILSDGVNLIIVEDLSRLARDHHIQQHFIVYLSTNNIDLITADTGTNVVQAAKEDPMTAALVQVMAIFNELECKKLVARLQKGRRDTGHRGGRPAHYPPQLKKRIRILRSKGNSYGNIADRFNLEGIETSTGHPWTAQLVRIVGLAEAEPKRIPRSRVRKEAQ